MMRWAKGASFLVAVLVVVAGCSSYPPLRPPESVLPAGVEETESGAGLVLYGAGREKMTGVIFYPGGLVRPEAYVSMLSRIASEGYRVVIVKMPFNLAVMAPDRARAVLDGTVAAAAGGPDRWVIAGHSLGGAMAARFAVRRGADYPSLAGVILLAAYPPDSDPLSNAGYQVLSIWATEDGLATAEDQERTASLLPVDAVIEVIDGGNHAGFGEYGPQKGDGERVISLEEQHEAVAQAILGFLSSLD
jgi:pimeloyl-ACP methyl ester carboxylesterase